MVEEANQQKVVKKPQKMIQIFLKKDSHGARGTGKAKEIIEVLTEYWDEFQGGFKAMNEDEQEEILLYFESIDENYSDILFGENSEPEDVKRYVMARTDAAQTQFVLAMHDVLDQVLHQETQPKTE